MLNSFPGSQETCERKNFPPGVKFLSTGDALTFLPDPKQLNHGSWIRPWVFPVNLQKQ